MKYYYTYKVQCTAVGYEDYYYLGQHTTSNLNDGYKGSGKRLLEYYKKYPEDYTFIILEFYSNKAELNIAEQKLIGDLWKTDIYCLNRTAGGNGGFKHVNSKPMSEATKQKISESKKGKPSWNSGKRGLQKSPNKGKSMSTETKQKISESRKSKYKGENHPMFGKSHPNKGKKLPRCAVNTGKHRVYREDGSYYMSAE